MTIGSLFSGIGGLELGLEWAGLGPVLWQVEYDIFASGVLAKHWPNAKRYEDVRHVGKENLESVDIICGGFPCQDVSVAGLGAGLDGERSGLWREFDRIIKEIQPRIVVIENVAALVSRGLDRVITDLERNHYRSFARLIKASDVGAPHRRERLFIVAHNNGKRREEKRAARVHDRGTLRHDTARCSERIPNANSVELRDEQQWMSGRRSSGIRDQGQTLVDNDGQQDGRLSESRLGRNADGLPDRVERWPSRPGDPAAVWEPVRSVTRESPKDSHRLHALGNAVVPQCAYEVGLFIRELIS